MRKLFALCLVLVFMFPDGGTMTHENVVTSPLVLFGENALAIKADATFTATDKQAFVDLTDLEGEIPQNRYITYEPDFWLLDGNYKFRPTTNARAGYISLSMSTSGHDFNVPPVLTITFGSVQSTTNGLTLFFSQNTNDYCNNIDIAFYDSVDALIRTDNYLPSSTTFSTNQAVSNFKKIIITFNETNKAFRYVRLLSIDFDAVTRFTGAEIKEARSVEQISPLSVELPINTFDVTLHSTDGDFSIVAPAGFYANLQYNEPLDVYEQVNAEMIYMGRFYLDTWESKSENEAVFRCVDALGVGVISRENYYTTQEGVWVNKPLEDVVAEILSGTSIDYEIDASFTGVGLYGYIPMPTRREALQQIAFAIGAYVTSARSDKILIKPFELASDLVSFDYTLTGADKGMVSPVTMRPLVTGVKILTSYYQYTNTADRIIFTGHLPLGTHTLHVPEEVINEIASQTGGAGVKSVFNYGATSVTLTVTTAGEFEISSTNYYERITGAAILENGSLPTGTHTNVISIDDATLVTSGIAAVSYTIVDDVIQRVYDYYQQRYIQKTKLFASLIAPGDSVQIDTQSGKQIAGIVEKITTDLAGGMVQDVEIVGVVLP